MACQAMVLTAWRATLQGWAEHSPWPEMQPTNLVALAHRVAPSLPAKGVTTGKPAPPERPPTPACADGTTRCEINTVVRCVEGAWKLDAQPCAENCQSGSCAEVCDPINDVCQDQTPLVCEDGAIVVKPACEGSTCKSGTCEGTCAPRTRRCGDGANVGFVQVCDGDGVWVNAGDNACDAGCTAGVCNGCTPGTVKCNGQIPINCVDGTPTPADPCEASACVEGTGDNAGCQGECVPGAGRCSDDGVPELCSGEGQWEPNPRESPEGAPCAFVCEGGRCQGVCAPGDVRCANNGAVQTCGENNAWGDITACAADEFCDPGTGGETADDENQSPAVAGCRACEAPPVGCDNPGDTFCENNDVIACTANEDNGCLERGAKLLTCPAGQNCEPGTGTCACDAEPPACAGEEGSRCQDGTTVVCTRDESGCLVLSQNELCDAGCAPDGKTCAGCQEGTVRCNQQTPSRCTAEGVYAAEMSCAAACVEGAGPGTGCVGTCVPGTRAVTTQPKPCAMKTASPSQTGNVRTPVPGAPAREIAKQMTPSALKVAGKVAGPTTPGAPSQHAKTTPTA